MQLKICIKYLNSTVSFICVGTPNKKNGELNMKYIYNVIDSIAPPLKLKKKSTLLLLDQQYIPEQGI